ncbi:MAG: hypothetical protein AAF065_05395 [Verrucomicrobiota bacterium]
MDLHDLRILLDFGMVVLLWLVQRVIYPSFLECSEKNLVVWHGTYVKRVGPIIIPMMFAQLPLVAWMTFQAPGLENIGALLCLLGCWLLTFGVSVPLHRKIERGDTSRETLQSLVDTNWPRTTLWTVAFVLGLMSR